VDKVRKAIGGKRKADEVSPEPVGAPPPSSVKLDPRPFKKNSSSPLFLDEGSSAAGSVPPLMGPPDSYPSSLHSYTGSDKALRLELTRVRAQLSASREELRLERAAREQERLLYEGEIEALNKDY
jgi:hypothetical protein